MAALYTSNNSRANPSSNEAVRENEPAVLVYDAECALCRGARDWIAHRVAPGALEFVPYQSNERLARLSRVSASACAQAIHLLTPEGEMLVGVEALPRLLGYTRHWRWLARVLRLPGMRRLAPLCYRWVARHRHALSACLLEPQYKGGRSADAKGEETPRRNRK